MSDRRGTSDELEATRNSLANLTVEHDKLKENYKSLSKQGDFKLLVERRRIREKMRGLLAIIHGDGGHHTHEVGFEQSVDDAVEKMGKADKDKLFAPKKKAGKKKAKKRAKTVH